MPTTNPQVKVTLTVEELARLRKEAQNGESDSNLIRRKLQLPSLQHGGKRIVSDRERAKEAQNNSQTG